MHIWLYYAYLRAATCAELTSPTSEWVKGAAGEKEVPIQIKPTKEYRRDE